MGNIFNDDFRDFITALNEESVEYILVGGYAVILHGYNRTTGDLDIWVNPTRENFYKLMKACNAFGLPAETIEEKDFLSLSEVDVFTFGRPPVSIDIMTQVKGLQFAQAIKQAEVYETESLQVMLINYEDLLITKKAAGRYKDLDDIAHLQEE
jgi:hypothetical protein